jgi:hypothetical protein
MNKMIIVTFVIGLMFLGCGGQENKNILDSSLPDTSLSDLSKVERCHPEAKEGTFVISGYKILHNSCSDGSVLSGYILDAPSVRTITMEWDENKLNQIFCVGASECWAEWDTRTISGCTAYFGGNTTVLKGGYYVTTNQNIVDTFNGYSFTRVANSVISIEGFAAICTLTWQMNYDPVK